MEYIFNNKKDLYRKLVELFEAHLKKNNQIADDIKPNSHIVSRRQFFYMKKISKGGDAPDISREKMNNLLHMLNAELESTVYFKLVLKKLHQK